MNPSRTKSLLVLAALVTVGVSAARAQTLYIPSGTAGIGTSSNGNVGLGTTAPVDRFQINATRPILFGNNGGYGVYGSQIGFNTSINTGVVPNTMTKLGGTGQMGGALITVDYWGDFFLQTYYAGTENASTVNYAPQFAFTFGGNLGIGTTNPGAKLQVGAWNLFKDGTWAAPATPPSDSAGERIVFYQGGGWKTAIGMDGQNGIWFQAHTPPNQVAYQWFTGNISTAPVERMRVMENGNVGIGTTNPTQKLSVNGTIRAREVIVETTGWSDDVFAPGYRLAPLSEVEARIKSEKHLPGIPSETEVAEQGVAVGDMQAKLLRNIEELTLHVIELEKQNQALTVRVQQLETVGK